MTKPDPREDQCCVLVFLLLRNATSMFPEHIWMAVTRRPVCQIQGISHPHLVYLGQYGLTVGLRVTVSPVAAGRCRRRRRAPARRAIQLASSVPTLGEICHALHERRNGRP